jgi:DNA replication and repair protein RecF
MFSRIISYFAKNKLLVLLAFIYFILQILFLDQLNLLREDEFRRGTNLVGPHRDEFTFRINDISLKQFGSQGQHKTFQTALRFAEFFYIKAVAGRTPLLLLDDVFGELDRERVSKISRYLAEVGQTFITVTDLPNFSFLKKSAADRIIYLEEKSVRYE